MVSRRGEFAVRGGILDVFPPTADHPYRVEFFGDEVDQVRAFQVADQRSLPGDIPAVELAPSRELLLTPECAQRARELRDEFPAISGMLERMSEGIAVEGMESLTPAVAGPLVSLADYLPEGRPSRSSTPSARSRAPSRSATPTASSSRRPGAPRPPGAKAPIDLGAGDFLTHPAAAR